jgi:hypothetical protein
MRPHIQTQNTLLCIDLLQALSEGIQTLASFLLKRARPLIKRWISESIAVCNGKDQRDPVEAGKNGNAESQQDVSSFCQPPLFSFNVRYKL